MYKNAKLQGRKSSKINLFRFDQLFAGGLFSKLSTG
jgi:hypothetical protein